MFSPTSLSGGESNNNSNNNYSNSLSNLLTAVDAYSSQNGINGANNNASGRNGFNGYNVMDGNGKMVGENGRNFGNYNLQEGNSFGRFSNFSFSELSPLLPSISKFSGNVYGRNGINFDAVQFASANRNVFSQHPGENYEPDVENDDSMEQDVKVKYEGNQNDYSEPNSLELFRQALEHANYQNGNVIQQQTGQDKSNPFNLSPPLPVVENKFYSTKKNLHFSKHIQQNIMRNPIIPQANSNNFNAFSQGISGECGNQISDDNEGHMFEYKKSFDDNSSSSDTKTSFSIRKKKWTEDEDRRLRTAVSSLGEKNWKQISDFVGERSDVQCLQRWKKVLKPGLRKGHWTEAEDKVLKQIVESLQKDDGFKNWGEVAKLMEGRTAKQCRERWVCSLAPNINKESWTHEEDELLIAKYEELGSQWSKIAKSPELIGRTENSVKNRVKSLLRKREREWTPEEDEVILSCKVKRVQNFQYEPNIKQEDLDVEVSQKAWHKIAQQLNNRTKNAVKNRWKELKRKFELPA